MSLIQRHGRRHSIFFIVSTSYAIDELSTAAFEVLLLHPRCGRDGWIETLMEQYSIEVVDAYGTSHEIIRAALEDLWSQPYTDIATGTTLTYRQWADTLSTEADVERYYQRIKPNRP